MASCSPRSSCCPPSSKVEPAGRGGGGLESSGPPPCSAQHRARPRRTREPLGFARGGVEAQPPRVPWSRRARSERAGGVRGGRRSASESSSSSASSSITTTTTTSVAAGPPTAGQWAALRQSLSGRLVLPAQPSYASDRLVYDLRFADATPAAIAYAATSTDVQRLVSFAREHALTPIPRCGGHSYGGYSTGPGLVVDVSPMNAVAVSGSTATVGGGNASSTSTARSQPPECSCPVAASRRSGSAASRWAAGSACSAAATAWPRTRSSADARHRRRPAAHQRWRNRARPVLGEPRRRRAQLRHRHLAESSPQRRSRRWRCSRWNTRGPPRPSCSGPGPSGSTEPPRSCGPTACC